VVGVVVEKDIVQEESESDDEEYIGEGGTPGERGGEVVGGGGIGVVDRFRAMRTEGVAREN